MKVYKSFLIATASLFLFACSSFQNDDYAMNYKGQIGDPIMAIAMLSEQQHEWAGTPYVLGGVSRRGVDCSGFVQKTFFDRFIFVCQEAQLNKPIMVNMYAKKIFKQVI